MAPKHLLLLLAKQVSSTPAGHGFPEVGNIQARGNGVEPVNRKAYPVGRNDLDRNPVNEQAEGPLPLV